MMNKILLTPQEAKPLIKEADLLFVDGVNWFTSTFIKWWTKSQYSHVAMASWSFDSLLEIVEFLPNRGGGATTSYDNYFPKYSGRVDIYRPDPRYINMTFEPINKIICEEYIELKSKDITNTMRELTGIPYGYYRIWKMFTELFSSSVKTLTKTNNSPIIYPVCSTAVAYSFEKNGFILLRHRNYEWLAPGDLAVSPVLNYLFSIK